VGKSKSASIPYFNELESKQKNKMLLEFCFWYKLNDILQKNYYENGVHLGLNPLEPSGYYMYHQP
jgi:hypothetical protein